MHNEAKRATTIQAAIVVRTLTHWITAQEDGLQSLASLPDITSLDNNALQQILHTAAQADWHGLALVDTTGHTLAINSGSPKFTASVLSSQGFFKQILATGKPAISGYLHCPLTGKFALLSGAPVIDKGTVRAILVASIEPHAVLKLFAGLGEESGSVITVTDQNNLVLARTLKNEQWLGRDFSHAKTVTAATKLASGTIEAVGIADPINRTYAFDRVPKTHWLVIVGVPTTTIYGPAHDWLIVMFTLIVSAIGLSVAFAYAATGHFTKPINQLVREALAIGRGDLQKRVNVTAGDEFGLLARAFNYMAESLELAQEHKLMVENMSESIRKSLDLDQILNTAVRELGQALSASRCCLALIKNQSPADLVDGELVFNYCWFDPNRAGTPLIDHSIPIGKASFLNLVSSQRTPSSMDILDNITFTPFSENTQTFPADWDSIKSLMACPINTNDELVGLILVQQCDTRRTWSSLELELVEAVATHVALAAEHATLYTQSKTMAEQELLINHIVRAVRSSLDLDTILNTVTRELGEALKADRCQIGQPRTEGPLIVGHEFTAAGLVSMKGISIYPENLDFHPNPHGEPRFGTLLGIDLAQLKERSDAVDNTTVRDTPIAVIQDVASDMRAHAFEEFLGSVGSRSLIAAPLLDNHRLLGVLLVHQCQSTRLWQPSEVSLVAALADQVAVAISHAQLFAQVKYQSITDGLTSLYNHVYLKKRLDEELRRSKRKGTPCSLLMIDLDKLKLINDTFGHPIGDAAIRQVSSILKNLLRSGDTPARYGGEEFAVILPETDLGEAALIANRLCHQINLNPVPGLGSISVSIGIAAFPSQADTLEHLVKYADQALYTAKHKGRNQVSLYQSESMSVIFQAGLKLATIESDD